MQINIKNIGKIRETNITIKGITVIAGKNDTAQLVRLYIAFLIAYIMWKKKNYDKNSSIRNIILDFDNDILLS